MKLPVLAAGLALAASMLSMQPAGAAAYSFEGAPTSIEGQFTLGFVFTANTDITVTSLGVYDANPAGFLEDHLVGIYDGNGGQAPGSLLASTVLAAGVSGVLGPDIFRYASIMSLTLLAGHAYTVATLFENATTNADRWLYGGPAELSGFSVSPLITIGPNAALFTQYATSLDDPATHFGDFQVYGVNFSGPGINAPVVPEPGVPEPASWCLMIVGLSLAGSAVRGRRRSAQVF